MNKEKWEHFKEKGKLLLFETAMQNDEATKRGTRIALSMIFATLCFMVGFFFINQASVHNTYKSVEQPYKSAMATLNNKSDGKTVTLVLHRTGCQACENAEKTIVTSIHTAQNKDKKRVFVVIDLKKLNAKQTKKVADLVPNVLINGKIPTPVTTEITKEGNTWVPNNSKTVVGDNKSDIKHLITTGD